MWQLQKAICSIKFRWSYRGAILGYNLFAHVRERVMIWRNPWEYASDAGYQLVQSYMLFPQVDL